MSASAVRQRCTRSTCSAAYRPRLADNHAPLAALPLGPPAPYRGPRLCRRARLSYEAFSALLAVIKDLNAGRAGRDATLAAAAGPLGGAGGELHAMFSTLLTRHGAG